MLISTIIFTYPNHSAFSDSDVSDLLSKAEETINLVETSFSNETRSLLSSNFFTDLPANYRPPSQYGLNIPTNSRVYNADLTKDLWSYLAGCPQNFSHVV